MFTKFYMIKFHNLDHITYFCRQLPTSVNFANIYFHIKLIVMETGIKNSLERTVTENNTAVSMGSGTLSVFATPAMVALIEETAWRSVVPYLDEGQATVGTGLNISHVSPTPLGMTVKCETELIEVDGRKLKFKAEVFDETGLIGTGTHERFIINASKFQAKADSKKA